MAMKKNVKGNEPEPGSEGFFGDPEALPEALLPVASPFTIHIFVDARGNFTYVPALLRARVGNRVRWKSHNGPFIVSFPSRTPFGTVSHFQGTNVSTPEAGVAIAAGATGVYKYVVAVCRPEGVFIDAGCPEIMI